MLDLEKQKEHFKNHIATFTDYGNIKILDFKNPESCAYRIRFLFEEDCCRLHISGDLGELVATNYNNMTYEKFSDFVNDTGYFEGKVNCHSRPFYYWDIDKARKEILEYVKEQDVYDNIIIYKYDFESEEDVVNDFLDEVLGNFDDDSGINEYGYDKLSDIGCEDVWEYASDFGKEKTGILELYMLAFKLAKKQIESEA